MPDHDTKAFAGEVLASVCADLAFGRQRLGVFAENVPPIDPRVFLSDLAKRTTRPARVALLGTTEKFDRTPAHLSVTTDPSEANRWRNDAIARAGTPSVFVVLGPAEKLNSLRTAVPILTATDVRRAIIKRCLDLHDTHERKAFLDAIGSLTGEVSNAALADFAARVEHAANKGKAMLLESEPTLVYSLGLIPSKRLFTATSEPAARKAIRKNLDRVRALTELSATQEKTLSFVAESAKHRLAGRASVILKYAGSRRLTDLRPLTIEEIDEVFSIDAPEVAAQNHSEIPRATRRERIDGDALALDLALGDHDGHGLKAAAKRYEQAIEPDPNEGGLGSEEFEVNGRTILPQVKTGAAQATTLFGGLLSREVWGGVVASGDALDLVGAMKLAAAGDAEIEEFRPDSDKGVRTLLKKAVERGIADASALGAWDAFSDARQALLPSCPVLINHPLLAFSDARVLGHATSLLETYSGALLAVRDTAEKLRAESPQAARRLVSSFLALDIAFVHARDEWSAVAAPTHPFHLWRWTSFHQLLVTHREELRQIGVETLEPLVTDPPAVCPQVVLSSFALKHESLDRPRAFVAVGTFAALPQFAEPTARQHGKFRSRELAKLAERLIRLMPHAALGFRVAVVDPPSVWGALDDMIDLPNPFDEDAVVPLHAVVLRTRAASDSTDEEDEAVATLARDLADHGGTLNVPTFDSSGRPGLSGVAEYLSRHPVHIAVVFDPGVGERVSVPLSIRPVLSPLVVPRAYRYDRFEDRLDLVVAGDAEPFSTYHELYCGSIDIPRDSFVGRRSGAFQSAKQIEHVARGCVWTVVIDQAIEPTLRIEGAPCIDWRTDGGRDLVTFTAHPETIENLIGDALRVAGLLPDADSRKRMLSQLLHLSGEAVLGLARAKPGSTIAEPRIAKGMVGVLASVRWYLEQHPDAIVISLDERTSRIWVLGIAEDDRHGDLLAVRPTDEGVLVEALEVKAHDDDAATVQEHGTSIGGKAVVQVDQTIDAVRRILTKSVKSPVLRARQDILRDQLYRAVASRPYTADVRGRLVSLLEELFSKGAHEVRGMIFRVKLAPGEAQRDAAPDWRKSPRDNRIGLVRLTETGPPGRFRSPPPNLPVASEARDPPMLKAQFEVRREGNTASGVSNVALVTTPILPGPAAAQRVLIGRSSAGDEVFWEPHKPDQPLNNFGLLVTGDPGSGKTQIIKCVIAAVADQRLPVCVFDFKNDYAEPDYAKKHGLRVHDVNRGGLPFNPLALLADATGEVQPIRQVHELAEILRRIYQLGVRQTAKLKDAIVTAYERHGVRVSAWQRADAIQRVPDFNEVCQILEHDQKNDGVLDRLSPLFDLNLFPDAQSSTTTFTELLADRVVLDLHSLPNDSVKAAMSEFIIVRLHGHVIKGEQPRELRRLLVFDEAWRVKNSERLQELAREGRAFGVGIVIGTQFPGDIPENLAGNLATQLLLSNQDPDHRRAVVRTLIGATSGPDAQRLTASLPHLQKHDGYFRNQHYPPYVLVNTIPYYKR